VRNLGNHTPHVISNLPALTLAITKSFRMKDLTQDVTNHIPPKFVVAVGASAGGIQSIIELIAQLEDDMDAALLFVLHLTHLSVGDLFLQRLQQMTAFNCKMAENGELLRSRMVYMAPPDFHLLVKDNKVILGTGPAENRWRPSIDALFRSVAASYNSRSIGIILSGLMQDGTSGMIAIQKSGGTCIVQDPKEAEFPDMPLSVINNLKPDYCLSLRDMGVVLKEKTSNGTPPPFEVPAPIRLEAAIAERVAIDIDNLKKIGENSLFSCPDCGGGLWEIHDNENLSRYRCHTGHVYTQDELSLKQAQSLENTLWIALRILEERKQLMEKIAKEEFQKGWERSAANKKEKARELEVHIDRLKEFLFNTNEHLVSIPGRTELS
jgi:two-component system, chemotaxis family, protein-glutamate methylesterase/glutaminase